MSGTFMSGTLYVRNLYVGHSLCQEPFMSGTLYVRNLLFGISLYRKPLCREPFMSGIFTSETFMLGTLYVRNLLVGNPDIENSLGREPLNVGNHKGREESFRPRNPLGREPRRWESLGNYPCSLALISCRVQSA